LPKTFTLLNNNTTCRRFIILVEESSIGLSAPPNVSLITSRPIEVP
jgi:hypothetical protein